MRWLPTRSTVATLRPRPRASRRAKWPWPEPMSSAWWHPHFCAKRSTTWKSKGWFRRHKQKVTETLETEPQYLAGETTCLIWKNKSWTDAINRHEPKQGAVGIMKDSPTPATIVILEHHLCSVRERPFFIVVLPRVVNKYLSQTYNSLQMKWLRPNFSKPYAFHSSVPFSIYALDSLSAIISH